MVLIKQYLCIIYAKRSNSIEYKSSGETIGGVKWENIKGLEAQGVPNFGERIVNDSLFRGVFSV